jgi:CBS domain-containing protein
MNRRDAHLDVMLRHLGAAYYESLHGRASESDLARALDSVAAHVGEHAPAGPAAGVRPADPGKPAVNGDAGHLGRNRGRWPRRIRDVMTTSVVTVDRITPYKEIARLMAEHRVSALPVLTMGRHVAGVVSETDLLRIEDQQARSRRAGRSSLHLPGRGRHWGLTAGELMTSPAITIHPDATIPAAAKLMNHHHLKQLPVVDAAGVLIGIASRRDLLSVFLRRDEDIAVDVRGVLEEILVTEPAVLNVAVSGGVVTLTGQREQLEQPDLIPVAVRLTWDIDGVVDVVDELSAPRAG